MDRENAVVECARPDCQKLDQLARTGTGASIDCMIPISQQLRMATATTAAVTAADLYAMFLAQVRSGHCLSFKAYHHLLNSAVDPMCPRCGEGPHTLEHWLLVSGVCWNRVNKKRHLW